MRVENSSKKEWIRDFNERSFIKLRTTSICSISFLSAMSLRRTSKDLNFLSFLLLPLLRQNLDKNHNLNKQINSNVNKEFRPKNSSQKSSQKIFPKKFSQKIPPKKFCQKIPPKKSSGKIPKTFQKKFRTISQKFPKILKISNSLHRT